MRHTPHHKNIAKKKKKKCHHPEEALLSNWFEASPPPRLQEHLANEALTTVSHEATAIMLHRIKRGNMSVTRTVDQL